MSTRIIVFMMLMFGVYLLTSCKGDRSLGLVEQAINKLDQQPEIWSGILSTTLTDLGGLTSDLARDVRSEVDAIYSRALEQTEGSTVCGEGFVGTQIKYRLQAVLHKYDDKKPGTEIVPIVCSTDPQQVLAGETEIVHFYGFDFMEFNAQESFIANVQYGDGGETLTQLRPIVKIYTGDHLTVGVPPAVENLNPSRSPQLVLNWKGEKVPINGCRSEIPIILSPKREVITFEGNASIKDDEILDDVYDTLVIESQDVIISPSANSIFHFEKCVGDEVRLEIDLDMRASGSSAAEIEIKARLYEGTSCDNDDLDDETSKVVYLSQGSPAYTWHYTLTNTEIFGGDQAEINLSFHYKIR